jgi:hypothetical protein
MCFHRFLAPAAISNNHTAKVFCRVGADFRALFRFYFKAISYGGILKERIILMKVMRYSGCDRNRARNLLCYYSDRTELLGEVDVFVVSGT